MKEVKVRQRGATRVSSKNQITIPVDAMRSAGIEVGDLVVARPDGPGRILLERQFDVIAEFAGALTGVYEVGDYEKLRAEWD